MIPVCLRSESGLDTFSFPAIRNKTFLSLSTCLFIVKGRKWMWYCNAGKRARFQVIAVDSASGVVRFTATSDKTELVN